MRAITKDADFLVARQIALLVVYCKELIASVQADDIEFQDAVDAAYDNAVWSGLVGALGDDGVQLILAGAFIGWRLHADCNEIEGAA
jgi:hypothetical protein